MSVTYFKRYRMEVKLNNVRNRRMVPSGFRLVPWSMRVVNDHADIKWRSFRDALDSHVFPCLGQLDGCRDLMIELANRKDFVPEATWLIVHSGSNKNAAQPVGTIQGLKSSAREGAIQNIGVHPEFRGLGLGSVLIESALGGFRLAGCNSAHLEVTVENTSAIRLYERLGFRRVETVYKIAEVQYAN